MGINPMAIKGNWDKGWVLDKHSLSSTYLGENAYGYPEYATERTELGQQIFLLKNRNRVDAVESIMELIKPFLDTCNEIKDVDVIMPVPPTNKDRNYQPAFEIAFAIAEYTRKSYMDDVLVKTTAVQSKDMSLEDKDALKGSIVAKKRARRKHNVLLVDDLIRSGMTLNECVEVLRKDENVDKIYVLVMTKTRR